MSFAENLRLYREKAGYKSAKDFSQKLGIAYTTYVPYETGKREPRFTQLVKIAGLLSVSIDTLLGYDPKQPNKLEKAIELLKAGGVRFADVSPAGNVSIYVDDPFPELLPPETRFIIENTPLVFPNERIIEIYDQVEAAMQKIKKEKLPTVIKAVIKNMMIQEFILQGIAGGMFKFEEVPKEGIDIHVKPKK